MDHTLLTEQILPIVRDAGLFIRSQFGKVTASDIETKSRNSLVSYVDKEAERMLVAGLGALIPGSTFITEEGTVAQGASEWTWIIDPLDGTTNFLQQIPMYSVSVGLRHGDVLVVGVVYSVEQDEMFWAVKGGGAWLNGQPIRVSGQDDVQSAVVATGFPYASRDLLPRLTSIFGYFLQHAQGIRRLGSAAIDLAYVACGRFDVYYETTLNPWDIAGGILIVEEAGGIVTDFSGERAMLDNGQVIAATPGIHQAVAEHIGRFFAA